MWHVTCDIWHVTRDMWHVTCAMWHVTCDTWHVTCDMWHVTCHMSHVTHDMWHVTCDTWHVTCDMWHVTCDMWHVTCDMCHVTCDMWHVTCDMWHITCDMWHVTWREWWQLSKKSRIRKTKNLSTDADSSTDTKKFLLVRQNLAKTNFFCAAILHPLWAKFSDLRPFLSILFPKGFRKSKKFRHFTLGKGDKRHLNRVNKWKKNCKKLFLQRQF